MTIKIYIRSSNLSLVYHRKVTWLMREMLVNIIVVILAGFIFSACTPGESLLRPFRQPVIYHVKSDIPSYRGNALYNSEELNYFLEIALGSEYGVGDYALRKWVTDLQIEIIGQPTHQDLQTVQHVMDDLNNLLAPHIRMEIVPSDGNVQMYFIPEAEFCHYEPPGIVYYGGFFWNWWNFAGEINRARVVIATDGLSQKLRSHLIREELTQILGLMNDSVKYEDSIFYQRYSETTVYSGHDRSVIKMLYNDDILPGMTDFEIREMLLRKNRKNRH